MNVPVVASSKLGPQSLFRACDAESPDAAFFASFKERFQAFEQIDAGFGAFKKAALEATVGATEVELENRRELDAQTRERFAAILHEAYSTGAMSAPVAFLESLSKPDLEVLRRAQALAEHIDTHRLSLEGAYNLLLPGGYKVDFNKDGLSEIGIAKTAFFPPVDAPQEFRSAWLHATEGLPEIEVMVHSLLLWSTLHQDQIVMPEQGRFVVVRTDLLSTYWKLLQDRVKMNEEFRAFLAPGQYERERAFYLRLSDLMGAKV